MYYIRALHDEVLESCSRFLTVNSCTFGKKPHWKSYKMLPITVTSWLPLHCSQRSMYTLRAAELSTWKWSLKIQTQVLSRFDNGSSYTAIYHVQEKKKIFPKTFERTYPSFMRFGLIHDLTYLTHRCVGITSNPPQKVLHLLEHNLPNHLTKWLGRFEKLCWILFFSCMFGNQTKYLFHPTLQKFILWRISFSRYGMHGVVLIRPSTLTCRVVLSEWFLIWNDKMWPVIWAFIWSELLYDPSWQVTCSHGISTEHTLSSISKVQELLITGGIDHSIRPK